MGFYGISGGFPGKDTMQSVPRPFAGFEGSGSRTRFLLGAEKAGLRLVMEAECTRGPVYRERPAKGRVFEDDCLELFLRPQSAPEKPALAPYYFGWEINPAGALLEYRAGIGTEGERMIGSGSGRSICDGSGAKPGVEPVFGILRDEICGTRIAFDYDWHSGALVSTEIKKAAGEGQPTLWTVNLFVPWADFGFQAVPRGERWSFTVNRIERAESGAPGLATLVSGTGIPAFHQPEHFAGLAFGD